jgi:hypothetical protein
MQSFIEFFEGFPALRPVSPHKAVVSTPKSGLGQSGVQRRRLITEIGEIVEQLSNGVATDDRDRRLRVIAKAVLFCLNRR